MFELLHSIAEKKDLKKGTLYFFRSVPKGQLLNFLKTNFEAETKETKLFLNKIYKNAHSQV